MFRPTNWVAATLALCAVVGVSIVGASAVPASASPSATVATTAPASASEPSMGLMLQLSSLQGTTSPATLRTWLERIRTDHHNKSKPGYIGTFALQDIASATGALYTQYLDVIAPYLPGGATPIFSNVYVGTVDLPWTGKGSKYIEGIESSAFRAQNIKVSLAAAKAFRARYPKIVNDWYVTYEANLSGFWDSKIEIGYRTYISQLMTTLSGVRPSRAYLWSPAFWTSYATEPAWAQPGLKANLSDLFAHLPTHVTLDVQDFVGQSGGAASKESAAAWVGYLKKYWSATLARVQINVEQFTQSTNGAISAQTTSEIAARESYYASKSIELGPAWEIRYWHQRLYGT